MVDASGLTYLLLHVVFFVPALFCSIAFCRVAYKKRPRATVAGVSILTVVAVLYTTPWDNYLIRLGVWGYGEGAVLVRIWNAPLGEYMFFVIQSVVTGGWASYVFRHEFPEPFSIHWRDALGGASAGILILVGGLVLFDAGGQLTYAGALLAWAGPVLALQWAFGWRMLWKYRTRIFIALAGPSVYLFAVDRIAILHGLWYLSPELTTEVTLPLITLPIEEAMFFVLTNLFLIQGLLLFYWVVDATDGNVVPNSES